MWYLGFHLTWRFAKEYAVQNKIKVPSRVPELLIVAVAEHLKKHAGADFKLLTDRRHRLIIVFYGAVKPLDLESSVKQIPKGVFKEIKHVKAILGVTHGARWYPSEYEPHSQAVDETYFYESEEDDKPGLRGLTEGDGWPEWITIESEEMTAEEAEKASESEEGSKAEYREEATSVATVQKGVERMKV